MKWITAIMREVGAEARRNRTGSGRQGASGLRRVVCAVLVLTAAMPTTTVAQTAPHLDSGDTAWMLTATTLVLLMTIPGLALFYGGMVRSKNLLSVLMQCYAIAALVSVLWVVYGYSLAFSHAGMHAGVVNLHSVIGGMDRVMLAGLEPATLHHTVPESVFVMFQLGFAIITPALIVGAFAERMKFSAMLWFSGLWLSAVYLPMAHMVWGGPGSLLGDMGMLDFAGGTVVHIDAGIAGLVACLVIGKRRGYPETPMPPHNLGYTVIGASLIWLGWFGFNAGSAMAADGSAGMAMLVTQTATAGGAVGWISVEWLIHRRPSMLGTVSGAIAGLIAVTPAAGTVGPGGALLLGLLAGPACFYTATRLKHKLGYDDTLDVFGVNAIAGIIGALLTGPLASAKLGGFGHVTSLGGQLWIQARGVGFTVIWSAVLSLVILKLIDWTLGLRVSEEQEQIGLDLALHEEKACNPS